MFSSAARWFNGPLDSVEEATGVLQDLGKSWLGLAAFTLVLGAVLTMAGQWHWSTFTLDVVLCAIGGYLLPRRQSRFLAVALFCYALVSAAVTVAARFGVIKQTGSNVILAAIVIAIAVRGVQATFAYHRHLGSTPFWRNIVIGVVAAGIIFVGGMVIVVVGALIFEARTGTAAREETLGAWFNVLVGLPLAAYYLICRDRLPWLRPIQPRLAETQGTDPNEYIRDGRL